MNSIFSYWHLDPGIMLFTILICLFYLFTINFKIQKQIWYFAAAVFVLLLCTMSPLHFLGENYLFSAHMVSHVLLLLIAGPLMAASVPGENRFKNQLVFFSKKINKVPVVGWLCGVAIMWFWHIPSIFNHLFVMHNFGGIRFMSGLMYLHIVTSIIAGIIFSWPIIGPYKKYRLGAVGGVLYLSTACVFCSLLGLIITFSHVGTYTHYLNITDQFGFLPTVRKTWDISVAADQQMAGLIMWVPCCLIYLSASMFLLIKWFNNDYKKASPSKNMGLNGLDSLKV